MQEKTDNKTGKKAVASRSRALADFLKSKRAALKPGDGHPFPGAGSRRRTPGLRREEVAEAAGVSTSWYTWLEQGRDIKPSPETLRRIGDVLRLTPAELEYLFRMAGVPKPKPHKALAREVPPSVTRLIQGLAIPAVLLDERLVPIRWNPAFSSSILDPRAGFNWMEILFLDEGVRERLVDWELHARRFVAECRALIGERIGEDWVVGFVTRLKEASPDFAKWWDSYEVTSRKGHLAFEVFDSRGGRSAFERTVYVPIELPAARLMLFAPSSVSSLA